MKKECTHVYYVYPLVLDIEHLGCPRDRIHEALQAEGVPVAKSYANLHLLPLYQHKIAYGRNGFPWNSGFYKGDVRYTKGICPVAEELNDSRYLGMGMCSYEYCDDDIDLIIRAFHKVWGSLEKLH